jgi:hypothetical protein
MAEFHSKISVEKRIERTLRLWMSLGVRCPSSRQSALQASEILEGARTSGAPSPFNFVLLLSV